MKNKFSFLDPTLTIGVLVSIFLSFILVLLGNDEISSLVVGLSITLISLGIDVIGRMKETEKKLLRAVKLGSLLDANGELHSIISEIVESYLASQKISLDLFKQRSKDALLDCKDVLGGIQKGYMNVEVAGKYSYGKKGADSSLSSIKAIAYEDVESWRTEHLKGVIDANKDAVQRGVVVERVFILKKDSIKLAQDVLELHKNAGVNVFIVSPDDLPKTELLESFMVVDDKVLVIFYYTRDGSKFRGEKISIDPVEVDRYSDAYGLIRRRSFKFELDKDESNS